MSVSSPSTSSNRHRLIIMNDTKPQYYVAKDGQTLGPYTEETISQCLREGRLAQADYVLHPEKQEWVSIATATFLKLIPEAPLPPLPQGTALPPLPTVVPLVVVRTPQRQTASTPPLVVTTPVPVAGTHGHETLGGCPLCGREMKKPKKLYGELVCKKCNSAFVNQRASAYIIDGVIVFIITSIITIVISAGIEKLIPDASGLVGLIVLIFGMFLFFALLSFKDSFFGKSLGKLFCRLRVNDAQNGTPAGAKASFVRNFILFIPYVGVVTQIIATIQASAGPRLGDSWAHTKVIWDKYADKSPFSFSGMTD